MLVEYESKTINNLTFEAIGWKVELPDVLISFLKMLSEFF